MLKVTFLGTGTSQGIPVISCECSVCKSSDPRDNRLRSSVLLETEGRCLSIDCGPDFRQQMLREGVRQMDGVLITHAHKDHVGGLDDLRAFNYTSGCAIDVYAELLAQKTLKKDFDYAFTDEKYPGVPEIALHSINTAEFVASGIPVIPIRGYHYRLPVLGFRVGAFAYLTDMNRIDAVELEKLQKLDTLVINALRREKHISHFTLPEALSVIAQVNPRRAYLTHISHQLGLHETVAQELPNGVELAYDGLKIEI